MSRSFLTPIDLNQLEVRNPRAHIIASDPGSPLSGQFWYNSTGNVWKYYNGSAAVDPLARAFHTGSQTASTISDLATVVKAYHLNEFAVPNANVPMGGFKITGLATPTISGDAAEFTWVQGQIQSAAAGIASKPPVRLVNTAASPTGVPSGLTAIDGVTPIAGDRVLVVGRTSTDAVNNGVWNAASGAWTRTTIDGAAPGEIEPGAMWMVTEGASNTGTQWRVSTTGAITIGTTQLSIVQFGASSNYTAGNGMTLVGSAFTVLLWSAALSATYTGAGLVTSASGVKVDNTIVALKYSQTLTTSATSYTITHNLGTQDVQVQVRLATSTFDFVECDIQATTANTVTLLFSSAPVANSLRVTVMG